MLGGAVGDAMGAPVENMETEERVARYGKTGVTRYEEAYGRIGTITDDTQMSLFTAEGLILSRVRREYAGKEMTIPAIYHAYLRWLYTQEVQLQEQLIKNHGTCSVVDGILTGYRELYSRRTPSNTCIFALRSGRMGLVKRPINDSKGCAGVTRAAPIGLAFSRPEIAFRHGCASAAITHGHPSSYLAAGFFSALISMILFGKPLKEAIHQTILICKTYENSNDCLQTVETAIKLAERKNSSQEEIKRLGAGWTADEALATGLFCSLSAGKDFEKGVLLSVNHSGNSTSTGSITGNIIGALYGKDSVPSAWLPNLEMKEVIEEMATDITDHFSDGDEDI
jgi:ADP-ribosylglycohydrolase